MHAAATRTSPTAFARALFAGLPARYDRLAAVLSLGQDRRWRREMIDHVADDPARPPCSTWPPARLASPSSWPTAPRLGSPASTSARTCCAAADATWPPPAATSRIAPRPRSGRAAAVPRRHLRRPHLHLPAALRRRPGRHHRRAGPGGAPRRGDGQPRVRRAPHPLLARRGGGSTPAPCSPSPAPRSAGGRGSTSVASSGPTSPSTTAGSRWPPPSPRGRRPGSPTSACAA